MQHCIADHPDITRIKVNVQDISVFQQLEDLGIPYEIYTINTQFAHQIDAEYPYTAKIDSGLYIQEVDAVNMELFESVIEQIMSTKSWSMFGGELSRHFFTERISRDLEMNYFTSFGNSEHGKAWLLYDNGTCVGTFMGSEDGDRFYGTLYGILNAYRSNGYSKAIYKFMFHICQENNWNEFVNEIHFQNQNSLNSALHTGMKPIRTFFNLTLFPLLHLEGNQALTVYDAVEFKSVLAGKWDAMISSSRNELNRGVEADTFRVIRVFESDTHYVEVVHGMKDDELISSTYLKYAQ